MPALTIAASRRIFAIALLSGLSAASLGHLSAQEAAQKPMTPAELEKTLNVPPMNCKPDQIKFDCVNSYIESVRNSTKPFFDQKLEAIKQKLQKAESAEEDFDAVIRIAEGLAAEAAESGPFAAQLDRIGKLIEKYRDAAAKDPARQDLVPQFDKQLKDWQDVRDRLAAVRETAQKDKAKLEIARSRTISLMQLDAISQAIKEAGEAVGGMENVLTALNSLVDATKTAAKRQDAD